MTQVLSTSSATVTSTSKSKVHPYGSWRFDDLRMVSDSLSSTTTYTYDSPNKLTANSSSSDGSMTYSYDGWGRMVTKNLQSGAHIAAYTYRYDSKLCTVTSTIPDESDVTNNYDGEGKLRSITTGGATKKLRWDNGWHPINLEDANGNLTTTFVNDPAREAAGSVLAAHIGSDPASGGTWAYLSQDHLGSTRHLRGQDRASLGAYEYTPYGDPYIATGLDLPQKFTGHWQVPQAGLYYAPYRMYAPSLARWLTRDPLGMADETNAYGYVGADPVLFMDPDGQEAMTLCAAGAALVLALAALGITVSWHSQRNVGSAGRWAANLWDRMRSVPDTIADAARAAIERFEARVELLRVAIVAAREWVEKKNGWTIYKPESHQGGPLHIAVKDPEGRKWQVFRGGDLHQAYGRKPEPGDHLPRWLEKLIDKYWPKNPPPPSPA